MGCCAGKTRAIARRRSAARNAGISLVEVLVAMSVLSIGLVGATSALRTCLGGIRAADRRDQALQIAAVKLDEIASAIRAGRQGEALGASGALPATGAPDRDSLPPGFDWTATVEPVEVAVAGLPALHRITVRVAWTEGGDARHAELWTEALGPLPATARGGASP